jgi:hypothetical protein
MAGIGIGISAVLVALYDILRGGWLGAVHRIMQISVRYGPFRLGEGRAAYAASFERRRVRLEIGLRKATLATAPTAKTPLAHTAH